MLHGEIKRIIRTLKNLILDFFYSGRILQDKKTSLVKGAYAGHASDYTVIDSIFKNFPPTKDDEFVDVGCGKGRVLLYVFKNYKPTSITGYELNKRLSDTAKQVCDFPCISVVNNDILDEFPKHGTYFYLFNPFEKQVLLKFLEAVTENRFRLVVYYNPPDLTELDINFIKKELKLEIRLQLLNNWMLPRGEKILIITRTSASKELNQSSFTNHLTRSVAL